MQEGEIVNAFDSFQKLCLIVFALLTTSSCDLLNERASAGSRSAVKERMHPYLQTLSFRYFDSSGRGGCTFAEVQVTQNRSDLESLVLRTQASFSSYDHIARREPVIFGDDEFLVFVNASYFQVLDTIDENGLLNLGFQLGDHIFFAKECHRDLVDAGYPRNDFFDDIIRKEMDFVLIGRGRGNPSILIVDEETAIYLGP
tara:strand:+ start:24 stop:623 length:600 start_codon:yes stop_codon:yes gene_type:complete